MPSVPSSIPAKRSPGSRFAFVCPKVEALQQSSKRVMETAAFRIRSLLTTLSLNCNRIVETSDILFLWIIKNIEHHNSNDPTEYEINENNETNEKRGGDSFISLFSLIKPDLRSRGAASFHWA